MDWGIVGAEQANKDYINTHFDALVNMNKAIQKKQLDGVDLTPEETRLLGLMAKAESVKYIAQVKESEKLKWGKAASEGEKGLDSALGGAQSVVDNFDMTEATPMLIGAAKGAKGLFVGFKDALLAILGAGAEISNANNKEFWWKIQALKGLIPEDLEPYSSTPLPAAPAHRATPPIARDIDHDETGSTVSSSRSSGSSSGIFVEGEPLTSSSSRSSGSSGISVEGEPLTSSSLSSSTGSSFSSSDSDSLSEAARSLRSSLSSDDDDHPVLQRANHSFAQPLLGATPRTALRGVVSDPSDDKPLGLG